MLGEEQLGRGVIDVDEQACCSLCASRSVPLAWPVWRISSLGLSRHNRWFSGSPRDRLIPAVQTVCEWPTRGSQNWDNSAPLTKPMHALLLFLFFCAQDSSCLCKEAEVLVAMPVALSSSQ